jgi:hypothetical protein
VKHPRPHWRVVLSRLRVPLRLVTNRQRRPVTQVCQRYTFERTQPCPGDARCRLRKPTRRLAHKPESLSRIAGCACVLPQAPLHVDRQQRVP